MNIGLKVFIRASAILLYFTFFLSAYLGLHVYLGNTTTIQDSREYTEGNSPDYFPMLIQDQEDNGGETLHLRSLALAEYSGSSLARKQPWALYQLIDDGTGVKRRLPGTKGVSFTINQLHEKRTKIAISIQEENNQRISTYTYEIEDNKAYPRSYILSSSFGHNFSPIPFLMLITGVLIYLSEKLLVKHLLQRTT